MILTVVNMVQVAFGLTWPYCLRPWRSHLLRWRMETYGVLDAQGQLLHAEEIHPLQFLYFFFRHARPLLRFLWWAARLSRL